MFPGLEQKERSGILATMWQWEPFKAKWSLVAKAYSLIRDSQGWKKARLAEFIAISGQILGIIEPDQYLRVLSYEIARDEDGAPYVRSLGEPIDERHFITNTSVNDLLLHSYRQGYFTGNLSEVLLPDNEASMTMATSVQPANQLATSSRVEDHSAPATTTSDGAASNDEEAITVTMDLAEDVTEAGGVNTGIHGVVPENHQMPEACNSSAPPEPTENEASAADSGPTATITTTMTTKPGFGLDSMSPVSRATLNALTADDTEIKDDKATSTNYDDVPSLMGGAFRMQAQTPHYVEFDPDYSSDVIFDPFLGDQFNVFEMSDAAFFNDFLDLDAF